MSTIQPGTTGRRGQRGALWSTKASKAARPPPKTKSIKAKKAEVTAALAAAQAAVEYTISVPEAGRRFFGIAKNAAYQAAEEGQIPTIRVGRLLRVPVKVMERMLAGD